MTQSRVDLLYRQATRAFQDGAYLRALDSLKQALILCPDMPNGHAMLGMVYERLGRMEEALQAYGRAFCLDPDNPELLANYTRCIEQTPQAAEIYNHLAIALVEADRPHQALSFFHRAIERSPRYAVAHNNLGLLLKSQGRLQEAIVHYRQAAALRPDYANAQWNLSLALLLTGQFEEGWQQFQWRRGAELDAILDSQRRDLPTWDGSPFRHQRLLIRYEQGLGDNIQFIRYIPIIKRLGGSIIVETLPPLFDLFHQIREIDRLVPASPDGVPTAEYDLFAFAMDLPGIMRTALHTIPADIPYLYADIEKVNDWRSRLPTDTLNIGIVWAGSPRHSNDKNRSCPAGTGV